MTTYATDDIVQLFGKPELEWAGFAQAVLKAWNPDTFENQVEVRGGLLTNLPVAAGVEALTFQAGQVLMLTRWKLRNGRGIATYWIGMGGRVIFPGSGAAEQAVAFLRGELARQILEDLVEELLSTPAGGQLIRGLLGQAIGSATEIGIGTRNNTGYGDLTGIPAGPDVTVTVGETGRALLILTADVTVVDSTGRAGFMSAEVSGASSIPANDGWALVADIGGTVGGQSISPRCSAVHLFGGNLTPGENTFTAKYRTLTTGGSVQWISPNITVIPF